MNITLSTESPTSVAVDVLAVPVSAKHPAQDPVVQRLDRAMGGALSRHITDEAWKAGQGQTLSVLGRGKLEAKRVLLVGMGDREPGGALLRVLGVEAARAGTAKGSSLAVFVPSPSETFVRALAEGVTTGAYRYARYLTGERKPKHALRRVTLLVEHKPAPGLRAAVGAGQIAGEAVNLARDLVNCPANDLTATGLADIAAAEAKKLGIACKVYDKKAIEKLGMPLLLAVNRGSVEEPRFFHMTYKPEGGGKKRVVFVGKGLTFDSGGLCLKTAEGMLDMKDDMAGAAATVAIVLAAARLALPVEVHGVVASTDNMTGGNAYRPGDVFPSRDGKTVEIINTDAEGRLVLADALAYARALHPDFLVDHATLTGACLVALGNYRAGLFSNDDELRGAYEKAAEASGEHFWPMPLDEDMRDQLKSSIADLKHTGSRYGGSITAALFLREFVGKSRWAHLDIAGPAFLPDARGIHPKGGTGFGVLTALELLRGLTA
ncbi:MAG: leucyl aminopeptidase [Polyangiales bacterium]